MAIHQSPSPNCGPRRNGLAPELVVLHYTAMASDEAALRRLCDPDAEVSAHYLIGTDGAVYQLVAEKERAWHAGAGSWRGRGDVNSRSIGIELANDGASPFPEAQFRALERLLAEVLTRWAIPPEGVIAHSDMAPARKSDPGPRFDWRRLAAADLAIWPHPGPAPATDPTAFRVAAQTVGYTEIDDLARLLAAFRLRFRPHGCGPLGPGDMAAVSALAERLGVDRDNLTP